MTLETKSSPVPIEEAWPFLEKLDASTVMQLCEKTAGIQKNDHRSLPTAIALALIYTRLSDFFQSPTFDRLPDSRSRKAAGSCYQVFLYSIPMTELTIIYGLPKHATSKLNYIDDRKDSTTGEKADLFLRLQRYAKLLRADPTATTMLENGVMSMFLRSAANTHETTVKTLQEHGLVTRVDDILKPEIRCVLNPQTLGYLQAYCDYRAVYPVAASQQPPRML